MTTRRLLVLIVVLVAASAASLPPASSQDDDADIEAAVCAVDPVLLQRTWRGYRPDRSGNLQLLTPEPDFIGQGGLPHSGPWDYIGDVPLVWYGPGYIEPRGDVDRRVTLADMAPTQAALLGFDFDAPDGDVLDEALVRAPQRPAPPRLQVVVVWDGAGDVSLDAWPDAWPVLERLAAEGTSYTEAEVGSSPPSTAQIHATIGTGAFTRTHGMIGHHFRVGPRLVAPWDLGPRFLGAPTLADLYDRSMGNEPVIGTVGMVDLHLGMMSHGSLWGGGDRDIAVLRQQGKPTSIADGVGWVLNPVVGPFYDLPGYVNELPPISAYFDEVDRADGRQDGKWLDEPIEDARSLFGFHTPARIPYQQRVIEEVVRREGFGADETPDLLFLNYKLTDEVGHIHTLNSEYMRDAIAAQDDALGDLVELLDEVVGRGRWVLSVTSDHGHTPDPAVTGATAIAPGKVAEAVDAEFDTDGDDVKLVSFTQPTMMHVNTDELAESGATLADVARFVMTIPKGDVRSEQWPGPEEGWDDPAFEVAYPSSMLETLPCVPRD